MAIIGLGTDMVSIAELRRWIEDHRNPFLPRTFVDFELEQIGTGDNRIRHIASRFAVKEAVLKALGTGFGRGAALTDVVTDITDSGGLEVRLTGGAATTAASLGVTEWRISICHADAVAIATVIAQGPESRSEFS